MDIFCCIYDFFITKIIDKRSGTKLFACTINSVRSIIDSDFYCF